MEKIKKIKLTNQENMSELALCWHQSKVTEEHWDVAADEKEKEWANLKSSMINPHCRTTVQILVSVVWDIISLHLKYDTDSQCSGGGGVGERLFPPLGDSCKTNWLQKLIKQHLRYKISRRWFLPSHFASNCFHHLLVLKWQ